ncbi:MAG: hypothetical protein IT260_01800 [Saprospiraceae bacterium]|nr:hypothetical protein [Saprospiraceae bacterium]
MDKRRTLPAALGLLLLGLLPLRSTAQVSASAAFDPPRVETGDTFSLRILVKGVASAPKKVNFEAWKTFLPAKNILSESGWTRSGAQWVQRYTCIAFDSAEWQLPPLTVRLHPADTILTNSPELSVRPTRASAEVRDMDTIRDISREPTHWTDYWPWGLGALAALGLLVGYIRRRPKRPKTLVAAPAPPPAPVTPAHEIALQKLAVLEQQKPWQQQGQTVAYYAALSLIVREYFEGRYGILALESTTREILFLLKKTNFPEGLRATLEHLLQQSDLAKFAEMQPPAAFHEKALASARQLVQQTQA